MHVQGWRGVMRCSQLHTFPLGNFHNSVFPVQKKIIILFEKNLHCTYSEQRKSLIHYTPKGGIIPLFQNKNSVILIPIFLFKALHVVCIIANRAQNIVHFVFRTRKTSFRPTRFFGIKRKQQQQWQQYSFKIIIYMYNLLPMNICLQDSAQFPVTFISLIHTENCIQKEV